MNMTVRQLLKKRKNEILATGKEESAVKMLISFYLNVDQLVLHLDDNIDEEINNLIDQYLYQNIPVQYIIGYTYFYNCKIKVNKNVLIPRFCTELLVEKAIETIKDRKVNVIDIATGSGCIAIAIKKNCPNASVLATDISEDALLVTQENITLNQVDVKTKQSDMLESVKGKFDVIVSNPPYIGEDDYVAPLVKENEPSLALYAKEDGLYYYRMIFEQSPRILKDNFTIFLEIGYNQYERIVKLINNYYKDVQITIYDDLEGIPRIVKITKKEG